MPWCQRTGSRISPEIWGYLAPGTQISSCHLESSVGSYVVVVVVVVGLVAVAVVVLPVRDERQRETLTFNKR